MNVFDDTLHRVLARHLKRAITIRASRGLSYDPDVTIGIATIKIVTEEQIQAIAYGDVNENPEVLVRVNPIGRDVTDLLPFARFINDVAQRAINTGGILRVWVPHAAALEALDILGHRYWKNTNAPEEVKRMGEVCRIIAHEATFPGQQVVVDATALLKDHVITGLTPIEEGHLGALLAWLDPSVQDPLTEGRDRIKFPISGVLPNTPDCAADDRIDFLRKRAKGASPRLRAVLEKEIQDILCRWVRQEWQHLIKARDAFAQLQLPAQSLEKLIEDSKRRIHYALTNGHFPARRPDRLAEHLAEMEAALQKVEIAGLESDGYLRAQAVRAGVVVTGAVTRVQQIKPKFRPCTISVDSDQNVIRLRADDKVRIIGSSVVGIVRGMSSTPNGGIQVHIEIDAGFRQTDVLSIGARVELIRDGYGYVPTRPLSLINQRQPWTFYGDAAPLLPTIKPTFQSALETAMRMRRT